MNQQVGQQLRQAREAKTLTLEQVSKDLHIRARYLQALEAGETDFLPSAAQVRGFLRSYASHLGLDASALLDSLESTQPTLVIRPEVDSAPIPASPDEDLEANIIFREIGETLRLRRELLGLSLDDIEAHTRIPLHYIQFIEAAEFERFPSPAQVRGMLHNYADFLEMDAETVLLRYAEGLQVGLAERQASRAARQTRVLQLPSLKMPRMPRWLRSLVSPDTILVTSLGILVLAITIWGIGRITRTRAELIPQPTAPSLIEALLPTATAQPSPSATLAANPTLELVDIDAPPEETAVPTIQVADPTGVQVFIVASQRAYLRVIVDGKEVFNGRILSGQSFTYNGQERIEILTGNAAALQIYYNNQDMGILGIFGEVVNLIYTQEGIVTPTARPTKVATPVTPTTLPTSTPAEPVLPPPQETPIP